MENPGERLQAGLEKLGLNLNANQHLQLINYVHLIRKWNRAYNLTAIRDELEIVDRHLLDSMAISPILEGNRWLDVGTGAGLPGIPLAIAQPDVQVDLLDSNGKKTRFLLQAVSMLGLLNVGVFQSRAETFETELGYDGILSRAFTSLAQMIANTRHLCAPGGHYYAMKGLYPKAEIDALDEGISVQKVHTLRVPGLDEERHLIVATATP